MIDTNMTEHSNLTHGSTNVIHVPREAGGIAAMGGVWGISPDSFRVHQHV